MSTKTLFFLVATFVSINRLQAVVRQSNTLFLKNTHTVALLKLTKYGVIAVQAHNTYKELLSILLCNTILFSPDFLNVIYSKALHVTVNLLEYFEAQYY